MILMNTTRSYFVYLQLKLVPPNNNYCPQNIYDYNVSTFPLYSCSHIITMDRTLYTQFSCYSYYVLIYCKL